MLAGELRIEMVAEIARLSRDMNEAKNVVNSAAQQMNATIANLKSAFGALAGAVSVHMFVDMVRGAIDAADHMNDLSKSTGLAVEQLGGLRLAARQSGGDLDSIAASVNKLAQNMGKDAEKFAKLGVSAKDPLQALQQLSDVFVAIKDPQLRAAVAAEALGKSWAGAAPLLSEGGQKIGEMVRRGTELSGVTKQLTTQADEFNDKLAELVGTGGMMNRMITPLLPLLNEMADQMLEARKQSDGLTTSFNPLLESMRALVVFGGNFAYVWRTIGVSIAGVGAQIEGFKNGGLKGFSEARDMMKKILDDERKAFDEWEARIMAAGKTPGAPAAPGAIDPAAAAAAAAKARGFVGGDDKGKAEAEKWQKMMQHYRELDAAGWVKYIDETTAEYERGLAEEAKRTEEFYKQKGVLDAADAKAMFDLIDNEQDFLIKQGEALVQDVTENTKALEKLKQDTRHQDELALQRQADMWRDVDRVAHDTFVSIFDSGKSTFDRLRDTLKNGLYSLLYNMTLKPILINLVTSAAGPAVAQSAFGAAASGASGLSTLGNLGSIGSALFGSSSAPSLLTSGVASGFQSLGVSLGSQGIADIGNALVSGTGALGAIGTALPYVGAALAAAQLLGVFGNKSKPAQFTGTILRGGASQSGFSGSTYGTSSNGSQNFEWDYPFYAQAAKERGLDALIMDTFKQMHEAAKSLGVDRDLSGFSAPINIGGLGESPAAVIQGFTQNIGQLTDAIASELMPNIASFQQIGESLSQTFARLASAAKEAKAATDQANAEAIKSAQDALRDAYKTQAGELEQIVSKWTDAAKTLRAYLTSSTSGPASYSAAAARFAIVAAQARAGSADAISQLPGVSDTFRVASLANSPSAIAYARDLAKIRAAVSDAAELAESQASVADQQLAALTQQVSALISIDQGVKSVADAIVDLKTATLMPAYLDAKAASDALRDQQLAFVRSQGGDIAAPEDITRGIAQQVMYYLNGTEGTVAQMGAAYGDAFMRAYELYKAIPGHAAGLPYVPYDNYLMRAHEGEAVLTRRQASDWRGGSDELLAELKALRAEVAAMRRDSAKIETHTRKTAQVTDAVATGQASFSTTAAA